MKCVSCETEINPKWKHAIDMNVCPFCGQGVMDAELKDLLSSLRGILDKCSAYPEQLNDWMLSNHNFIKTDAENLISFVSKKHIEKQMKELQKEEVKPSFDKKPTKKPGRPSKEAEDMVVIDKQSDEKAAEFHKRAEAVKPNIEGYSSLAEKTQHLKAMAAQIKKESGLGSMSSKPKGIITADMMNSQPEFDVHPMLGEHVNSSLDYDEDDDADDFESGDDDIPASVLAAAGINASSTNNVQAQADLAKLQSMRNKQAGARKRLLSGKGSFSRS